MLNRHVSEMDKAYTYAQLLELTTNGKSYFGKQWHNFQVTLTDPCGSATSPVLMAVIVMRQ